MQNSFKLILTFALVIAIIFATIYCLNKPSKSNDKLQYIYECIDGRVCAKLSNEIYVGNNEKELKNGYYDFKILNSDVGITIVINKLWYKEFNERLYEDEYVEKLCRYIYQVTIKSVDITFTSKDLDCLYNNILESYLKAKENIQSDMEYILSNIKFKSYTDNYELVLNMEVV